MFEGIIKRLVGRRRKKRTDVKVISFPKSGRTWHHLLVGNYLARVAGADLRRSMQVRRLCEELDKPVIGYVHNGANFDDGRMPCDPRVANPQGWRGAHVILLVRDLKDVLTSAYFHARHRKKIFHGSIGEFIRNPRMGAEKVLTAYHRWAENRRFALSFTALSYEGMHRDTAGCLIRTLEFAGHGPVDQALVAASVAFCTADNMRSFERMNFFKASALRPGKDKSKGAKVRSARIGDHANHLSEEDVLFIDEMEKRMGNPFLHIIEADKGLNPAAAAGAACSAALIRPAP